MSPFTETEPDTLPNVVELPPLAIHPVADMVVAAYKWTRLVRECFIPKGYAARVHTQSDLVALYHAVSRFNGLAGQKGKPPVVLNCCKLTTTVPPLTPEGKEHEHKSWITMIHPQAETEEETLRRMVVLVRLASAFGTPNQRRVNKLNIAQALVSGPIIFLAKDDAAKAQSYLRRFAWEKKLHGSRRPSRHSRIKTTYVEETIDSEQRPIWRVGFTETVIEAWKNGGHRIGTLLSTIADVKDEVTEEPELPDETETETDADDADDGSAEPTDEA